MIKLPQEHQGCPDTGHQGHLTAAGNLRSERLLCHHSEKECNNTNYQVN